jgi:hypothetical protein
MSKSGHAPAAALLSHLDQLLEALTKADAESATVKKKTSDLARQLLTPAYTAHSDKVRGVTASRRPPAAAARARTHRPDPARRRPTAAAAAAPGSPRAPTSCAPLRSLFGAPPTTFPLPPSPLLPFSPSPLPPPCLLPRSA